MSQTIREGFRLGLKFVPALLELTMATVVNGLPIVINDKVRDIDLILGKSFHSFNDFVFRQALAKSVPGTFGPAVTDSVLRTGSQDSQ